MSFEQQLGSLLIRTNGTVKSSLELYLQYYRNCLVDYQDATDEEIDHILRIYWETCDVATRRRLVGEAIIASTR